MAEKYDFAGWATRNDLRCSDGRIIRKDAFKVNDGQKVPLVWNHQHNDSKNVLGHALLENREDGVYAYGFFNNTDRGQSAKEQVMHGDIEGLSIFANKLKEVGDNVIHGVIREVSLVLAGANPGAYIEEILAHGEDEDSCAVIYTGEELVHSDEDNNTPDDDKSKEGQNDDPDKDKNDDPNKDQNDDPDKDLDKTVAHSATEKGEENMADKEKTVQDVIDSMTEEQKNVMYAMVGMAAEGKEGDKDMKQNAFDAQNDDGVLAHSEEIAAALADGKRYGSMKESFLAHGIDNIEYLFPDAQNLTKEPGIVDIHPKSWVKTIMNGVHHTPFSRIKMMFADVTNLDARAKGYVKGNFKKEEVISLMKRTVTPTTVYKKQKLDRDDIIDITDFDVVAWLKKEMRMKLDEELSRAFIFGDGRLASDEDKINEGNIIPVVKDTANNFYAMEFTVTPASGESLEHAIITKAVTSFDDYEGSGNTVAFMLQSEVTKMLLLEDNMGRRLYNNLSDLAAAMTVGKIEKVPASIMPSGLYGVILDLSDYNVGADKGGAVNMFEDFDIDYNAEKYLIETRCSGALTVPHSAIILKAAA